MRSYQSQNVSPSPAISREHEKLPDYILYNVIHQRYIRGILALEVSFDKGSYYSNDQVLRVENSKFRYYDSNGEIESKGRSDHAQLYRGESLIIAEGNVVIISEMNGVTLYTDYLEWHGDKNEFLTDKPVKIQRENGDTIYGIGMYADVALRRVTILHNVKGTLTGG